MHYTALCHHNAALCHLTIQTLHNVNMYCPHRWDNRCIIYKIVNDQWFPTSLFLEASMFYTQRMSGFPSMFVCPPYIYTPLGCTHTHMSPILFCASVCSQRLLLIVGGCKRLPYMLGTSFTPLPI